MIEKFENIIILVYQQSEVHFILLDNCLDINQFNWIFAHAFTVFPVRYRVFSEESVKKTVMTHSIILYETIFCIHFNYDFKRKQNQPYLCWLYDWYKYFIIVT